MHLYRSDDDRIASHSQSPRVGPAPHCCRMAPPAVDEAAPARLPVPAHGGEAVAEAALVAAVAADEHTSHAVRCPIVCVEGFLGGGSAWYWNQCIRYDQVIIAKLGPVSSLHDRACELFYQLKGGTGTRGGGTHGVTNWSWAARLLTQPPAAWADRTVDYGAEHAEAARHERFGRTFPGVYPWWSARHPVHFFGHSIGGCTVRYLHHLLHTGFFKDHATSADWILSVTTLSTPHLGTTAVRPSAWAHCTAPYALLTRWAPCGQAYILGECEDTPPDVQPWSIGRYMPRSRPTEHVETQARIMVAASSRRPSMSPSGSTWGPRRFWTSTSAIGGAPGATLGCVASPASSYTRAPSTAAPTTPPTTPPSSP
jgi:hypothetical protein